MSDSIAEYAIPHAQLIDDELLLRPWNPDSDADVAALLAGATDPEFNRWNTPAHAITTIDGARASLHRRQQEQTNGTGASFCITDKRTGTVLGHVAVNAIVWDMRRAVVGFWLLPAARGRGVAGQGLMLVTRWAFESLRLHRLELIHAIGNDASCVTAQRCGYAYEGTLRDRMFEAGDRDHFRDAHLHARVAGV